MLVSAIAPWVANWLFFIEAGPMENLDPTPFAFFVSVAVLWCAVYRVRLLDITPVALKSIFENITSGVIVLDELERVVASNESAKAIVGRSGFGCYRATASGSVADWGFDAAHTGG
jgi:PAS domain-containing protein